MKDFAVKHCHFILRMISVICISFALGYYAYPFGNFTDYDYSLPMESDLPATSFDLSDSEVFETIVETAISDSKTEDIRDYTDSFAEDISLDKDSGISDYEILTPDTKIPVQDSEISIFDMEIPVSNSDGFSAMGGFGRIELPELGYSARLSAQSDTYDNGQSIVDEMDHALLCDLCPNKLYGGLDLIADHSSQGFDVIKGARPYQSHCIITESDGSSTVYICTGLINGHNDGYCVTGADYQMLEGDNNMLALYTCNENWQNITIALFEKLSA